jgi:branched-chain amino acid transport system substrate-binding protein
MSNVTVIKKNRGRAIFTEYLDALTKNVICAFFVTLSMLWLSGNAMSQPIVFGQSLSLSGPDADRAKRIVQGTEAFFIATNRRGGVNGKRLVLQTLDDGGDRTRAIANMNQLATELNALSLLNMAGGRTCVAALEIAAQKRIPLVGCMAGSPQLRAGDQPYVFNIRPGHDVEYEAMAKLGRSTGVQKALFLYDDSPTGAMHLTNARNAMKAHGIDLAASLPVNKQTAVDAAIAYIKSTEVGLVFNQGPNSFFEQIVRSARANRMRVQFMSVCSGADSIVKSLGSESRGIMFSQVVPFPFASNLQAPIIDEYLSDLKRAFPEATPSYDGFESYLNARILVHAIKRSGKSPSRESIKAALTSMPPLDVGGFFVDLRKRPQSGSSYVEMVMASHGSRNLFVK